MQRPDQGYINHVGLVLDASDSMRHLRDAVVKVADNQVAYLAQRSQELDQETRMTCYTFNYNYNINCVYYDKDVLRMQSLAGKYSTNGMTALCGATLKAIEDLRATATLYGDHAFLLYVLTDGQENDSRPGTIDRLQVALRTLPDNWTVAVLVPDQRGVFEAKKFGFAPDNIAQWDTTERGIREVGEMLRRQTDTYMTARSQGVKIGNRGIFSLDLANLSTTNVRTALDKLTKDKYDMFVVQASEPIKSFVESHTGRNYRIGSTFYEFTKAETIQAAKQIAIREAKTGAVYTGSGARRMLGLPDGEVRVTPSDHPEFDLFVQSTSVNRKLVPGTNVLVLK